MWLLVAKHAKEADFCELQACGEQETLVLGEQDCFPQELPGTV